MTEMTVDDILQQYTDNPLARKREFFRYYSHKRIQHQLKQLEMLKDVSGVRLTEIGSYLGFATALFQAAGFQVRTIDAAPVDILGEITPEDHISKNILDITSQDVSGQEVVVCCETLEHLHFTDVEKVLEKLQTAKVEWLLISVPYRCLSIDARLVVNPFSSMFKWIMKLPTKTFRAFKPDPEPHGHKWELGYKGYGLDKLTSALDRAGFRVEKQDYVGSVQSVFMLSRRIL